MAIKCAILPDEIPVVEIPLSTDAACYTMMVITYTVFSGGLKATRPGRPGAKAHLTTHGLVNEVHQRKEITTSGRKKSDDRKQEGSGVAKSCSLIDPSQ